MRMIMVESVSILLRQLLLSFFCWSFHLLFFELVLESLGNREAAEGYCKFESWTIYQKTY